LLRAFKITKPKGVQVKSNAISILRPETNAVETKYQLGFLPLVYYRVEF
jgi:hypothetical protein